MYSLHVVSHPFDGFWDLKHEKKGSYKSAFSIIVLLAFVFVFERQNSGFLFNFNDLSRLNIISEIMRVIVPFLLWCAANWCLTTLMDGEGSYKDIFISTAYAIVPLILIKFPVTIASNFATAQEGVFLYVFQSFAVLWTVYLLFVSTMTIHQYSLGKTVVTMLLIVVGIGIIVFIGVLFFNLILEITGFVSNLVHEINFRI